MLNMLVRTHPIELLMVCVLVAVGLTFIVVHAFLLPQDPRPEENDDGYYQ